MTTIGDRLAVTRNRATGFDWLRLGLSVAIVCWHTIIISYGRDYEHQLWTSPLIRPFATSVLGMFFALSRFLVAGSLERCQTLVSFAGLRIMRIFPALVVEVTLSALVLGPLLTEYSVGEYFRHPQFLQYFLNMIGDVHFPLPGVFMNATEPNVTNVQLWTIPIELRCYEILIGLSLLRIYASKRLFLLMLAVLLAFFVWRLGFQPLPPTDTLRNSGLISCFVGGVALFRFRQSVPWSAPLAVVSAVAVFLLLNTSRGDGLAPIPIIYLTVYLGLLNPPKSRLLFSGDYSYGLYLYSFPIQQTIYTAGPWAHHWYVNLLLGLPAAAAVAVFSWWCVEKPVVRQKAILMWLEDRWLAIRGRIWARVRGRRIAAPD